MKNFLSHTFLSQVVFTLIFSCSNVLETEPIYYVEYTLSVTAGEGGSVYPNTGAYVEGTVITLTANPDQGLSLIHI